MQTFINDHNLYISAHNLDRARLGKQRAEALQVGDCLLDPSSKSFKSWSNHPASKMWKGHEAYLIKKYIPSIFFEWSIIRGYKNEKSELHWNILLFLLNESKLNKEPTKPYWITDDFIERHRSNLIEKKPDHYKVLFPNTKEGLEYIWPK